MALQNTSAFRLLRDRRGSVSVEYAIVAATLIGSLSMFTGYGTALSARFAWVAQVLQEPSAQRVDICSPGVPPGGDCQAHRL